MPYVSDADASKSKPLAQQQSKLELAVLLVTGVVPCLLLGLPVAFALVTVVVVFRLLFKRWLLARIGGFTGDCLGAAQQLSELLIYLTLIAWMVNSV
jgi:adenosylcobinamide-GDP ribazoletransferase